MTLISSKCENSKPSGLPFIPIKNYFSAMPFIIIIMVNLQITRPLHCQIHKDTGTQNTSQNVKFVIPDCPCNHFSDNEC